MEDLAKLANLLNEQNKINAQIAEIIQRPAQTGHIGEYIASKIFDIELNQSAAHAGMDGYFRSGILLGKSVDAKYYGKREGLHNVSQNHPPDYYLIMTGEKTNASSSRGKTRPFSIKLIYLFEARELIERLVSRGVKIGIATSMQKELWSAAEIYPAQTNRKLMLNDGQKQLISLFNF